MYLRAGADATSNRLVTPYLQIVYKYCTVLYSQELVNMAHSSGAALHPASAQVRSLSWTGCGCPPSRHFCSSVHWQPASQVPGACSGKALLELELYIALLRWQRVRRGGGFALLADPRAGGGWGAEGRGWGAPQLSGQCGGRGSRGGADSLLLGCDCCVAAGS